MSQNDSDHVLWLVRSERRRQEVLKAEGRFEFTCADDGLTNAEKLACLTEAFSLHSRCPRLAKARDERRLELADRQRRRMFLINAIHEKERIVAHRELQYHRSLARWHGRKSKKYLDWRESLLNEARAQLARLRQMKADLEAER